jgi:tryptophan synthase alpha chain
VDLPAEDSGPAAQALAARGVELVLLASPTTTDARLRAIGRASGSIVYYVSREGVTGVRAGLATGLAARLAHVRRATGKPLIVGFGVAEPAQARALAAHADGVVVGSALVAAAAKAGAAGAAKAVGALARRLVKALEVAC